MDDYIERGLVERLTPVRSSIHRFRLLVPTVIDVIIASETSLTHHLSQANAGACENRLTILWARRKVRTWPYVGDTRAIRVGCRI